MSALETAHGLATELLRVLAAANPAENMAIISIGCDYAASALLRRIEIAERQVADDLECVA